MTDETTPRPRPRRAIVRWRIPIAGAAAIVVATVVLARIFAGGSDDRGFTGAVGAASRPDPLPRGPVVRSVPFDCGVPYATADRLTSGAEKRSLSDTDRESCTWEHIVPSGGPSLAVEVSLNGLGTGAAAAAEDVSRKIEAGTKEGDDEKPGRVRTLDGLGDEAVIWDAAGDEPVSGKPPTKTTVVFRTGNATVQAAYEKPGPAQAVRDGAIQAAQDVARSLGVPPAGVPRVTDPPARAAPIRELPNVCEMLSPRALKRLKNARNPKPDDSHLVGDDDPSLSANNCTWTNDKLSDLQVDVAIAGDSRLGPGDAVMAREYASEHLRARDSRPESGDGEVAFTALAGPGDRAFAYFKKDSSYEGVVVFQIRNALVKVRYWDIDEIPRNEAVKVAYDGAREIAGRLAA